MQEVSSIYKLSFINQSIFDDIKLKSSCDKFQLNILVEGIHVAIDTNLSINWDLGISAEKKATDLPFCLATL